MYILVSTAYWVGIVLYVEGIDRETTARGARRRVPTYVQYVCTYQGGFLLHSLAITFNIENLCTQTIAK